MSAAARHHLQGLRGTGHIDPRGDNIDTTTAFRGPRPTTTYVLPAGGVEVTHERSRLVRENGARTTSAQWDEARPGRLHHGRSKALSPTRPAPLGRARSRRPDGLREAGPNRKRRLLISSPATVSLVACPSTLPARHPDHDRPTRRALLRKDADPTGPWASATYPGRGRPYWRCLPRATSLERGPRNSARN